MKGANVPPSRAPDYRKKFEYIKRSEMTPEELEEIRAYMRNWQKTRLAGETVEQRAARLATKRRYRATAKAKATERACRAKYDARPGGLEARRIQSFKVHHGVSRSFADAKIKKQRGKCLICRKPPDGRGNCSRLHVDHDPVTGEFRGMLCHRCNRGMGFFRHDPKALRAAAAYLERS